MQLPSTDPSTTIDSARHNPPALLRVLIVDGDSDDAASTESALRNRLHERVHVQHICSQHECIETLRNSEFDVVIVELGDTNADAESTLAIVEVVAPVAPVVVYTRLADDSLGLQALRRGAQDFLVKDEAPVHLLPRALKAAIERHSRLSAVERERRDAAHRAAHDQLTGLANRGLFLDQLERALAFGARYGRKTGVLFVDLDDFKVINDTHGHAAGDTVLRQVSARLTECVRKSDSVARLGGDEFGVMLQDVTSRRDMVHVRRLIHECLSAPVELNGATVPGIRVSIGSAMSPLDGSMAETLLDAADARMYRAKTAPTGFGSQGRSAPLRREQRLRHALESDQFQVHYQPVIDTATHSLTGAEALLRWQDPDRGLVSPATFLPLAEDTGLIVPIGEFVLREACKAAVGWRDWLSKAASDRNTSPASSPDTVGLAPAAFRAIPGMPRDGLRVSVNLSAVQLRERDFEDRVHGILEETGCPPELLIFELTESSALVDGDLMIESLRAIKQMGIQLAIDDFGVGYASMTFLREAPIDGIKIDRRFVANLLHDRRDAAIVSSLIRLARGLSLSVTGEGIETVEQSRHLARLQCFEQQGLLFSDVITRDALSAVLEKVSSTNHVSHPIHKVPDSQSAIGH